MAMWVAGCVLRELNMRNKIILGAAFAVIGGAASAASVNLDFLTYADGLTVEEGYSTFNTSSVFGGPNLAVTATKTGNASFVYFDKGNAGLGNCGKLNDDTDNDGLPDPNGSGNVCDPSSDDGITALDETVTFEATNGPVKILSITFNANHDSDSIYDATWNVHGTAYDFADFDPDNDPDNDAGESVTLILGATLNLGETLTLFADAGSPNTYIQSMLVSTVPVPAGMFLMLGGLGGLAALRRMKA